MTKEIKDKLDAEILSELNILKDSNMDSDSYKTGVECLAKLIDKRNEIDKIELEISKHRLSEEKEADALLKEKEQNEYNRKNQLITHIISIGSIIIPVFVTIWGTYKTLKFEETGTVTTIMGRGFINKLLPKK